VCVRERVCISVCVSMIVCSLAHANNRAEDGCYVCERARACVCEREKVCMRVSVFVCARVCFTVMCVCERESVCARA